MNITDITLRESWLTYKKNSIITEYYSGVEAGNPSGNKNIKSRKFYNGTNELIFTVNYEWDADDDIVKEYTV